MPIESKSLRRKGKRRSAVVSEPRVEKVVKNVLDGWVLGGLDYPSFRLSLVAKIMDRLTMRQFGGPGKPTYPEWRVMSRLFLAADGLTVRQLADQAWVDRAETSRAAAALEKRGLTHRRANPRDKRMPILFLTEAGRRAYGPILAARSRFHEDIVASLTGSEKHELDRLLKKMVDRLLVMSESPITTIVSPEKPKR